MRSGLHLRYGRPADEPDRRRHHHPERDGEWHQSRSVALNFGQTGLTQYADSSGGATTNTLTQDGYTSGTLSSVAVSGDGKINGTFSNGSVVPLATVGFARFTNPDGLKPDTNGHYFQTVDSGSPLAGLAGSTIVGESTSSRIPTLLRNFRR